MLWLSDPTRTNWRKWEGVVNTFFGIFAIHFGLTGMEDTRASDSCVDDPCIDLWISAAMKRQVLTESYPQAFKGFIKPECHDVLRDCARCPESRAVPPCGRDHTDNQRREEFPEQAHPPHAWSLLEGFLKWSGRQDSNLRPTVPKTVALPGCATPRLSRRLATGL